jgi:hypothetical protein
VGECPPKVGASIDGLQKSPCDAPGHVRFSQGHGQVSLNRPGVAAILAISEPSRKLSSGASPHSPPVPATGLAASEGTQRTMGKPQYPIAVRSLHPFTEINAPAVFVFDLDKSGWIRTRRPSKTISMCIKSTSSKFSRSLIHVPLPQASWAATPPFLHRFPQLNYEHSARLFTEIRLRRTHVRCGLPEAEQLPLAHPP